MTYEEKFRDPSFYLGIIQRLQFDYEKAGCFIAAADLRKEVDSLTDFPSLKMLADRSAFLHTLFLERK